MVNVTPGCVQSNSDPIPADYHFTKILVGAGISATKTVDCELVLSSDLTVDGHKPRLMAGREPAVKTHPSPAKTGGGTSAGTTAKL